MCDIWKANRNGQELALDDLAPHMATFRNFNVRWVVLSGGEALMHSNLWKLCELLRQAGVQKITVLSTGLLLERHAADVVRWSDEVTVSLDGSREVHDAIRRVPRAFDRLADGVAALHEIDPTFQVTGRCVIQRDNYHDLPNIIQTARDLRLSEISFFGVDVSTTAFNRPTPWDDDRVADVALSRNEVAEFEQLLEETITRYAEDFASGFIAESPAKMRRLVAYFAALNGDGPFPEPVCNAPWISTVVEADGTVRPCFFHQPLGNIDEQPLDDILNSDEAIEFRRQLDVTQDPICRKCVCTLHIGRRQQIDRGP